MKMNMLNAQTSGSIPHVHQNVAKMKKIIIRPKHQTVKYTLKWARNVLRGNEEINQTPPILMLQYLFVNDNYPLLGNGRIGKTAFSE